MLFDNIIDLNEATARHRFEAIALWSACAYDYFNFEEFSKGRFVAALTGSPSAETLTRVLYPNDSTSMGQGLRLVQEYFLVACSLVRRFPTQQFGLASLQG
jgi:starch phosphorylase